MISVLLVEDDPFWTMQISECLTREPDVRLLDTAASVSEAIPLLQSCQPDVVLLDIHLGGGRLDGLDILQEITTLTPRTKVIVLTSMQEHHIIVDAFELGAINYITKSSYRHMIAAIREAHSGSSSIHPDAAAALRRQMITEKKLRVLTPAEREVYELRDKGMSRLQISNLLFKSIETIKVHLKNIKKKLGSGGLK